MATFANHSWTFHPQLAKKQLPDCEVSSQTYSMGELLDKAFRFDASTPSRLNRASSSG